MAVAVLSCLPQVPQSNILRPQGRKLKAYTYTYTPRSRQLVDVTPKREQAIFTFTTLGILPGLLFSENSFKRGV